MYVYIYTCIICNRRKFRSQISDNMDTWKSRGGKSQRREEQKRDQRRQRISKDQKKKDAGARKGRKVATHCVFPMICGSGGSKSRLAKAAGAEPSGQMRNEKLHAVVARSTFPSQNVQSTPLSDHLWKLRCRKSDRRSGASTFGSQKCEKLTDSEQFWKLRCPKRHTVVARSTFQSQNLQSTPASEHLWKLRCSKSVRRCGAKHISKSKMVENVKSTTCSDHFWRFRCGFAWQAQGIRHLAKSEQNVCSISKKGWQAWDICRGSAKMHFAWQAQYKRHVHQTC